MKKIVVKKFKNSHRGAADIYIRTHTLMAITHMRDLNSNTQGHKSRRKLN